MVHMVNTVPSGVGRCGSEVWKNMESSLAVVEVKALFQRDPNGGWYLRGSFVNYSGDLRHAVNRGQIASSSAGRIVQALNHITWDLWNIGSLIARLDWTDQIAQRGQLDVEVWRHFCSLDIEHFHIELRSVLDYAAMCVAASANQLGTVPQDSMNELLKWLQKNPGNRARLGEDLAALIDSLPSFPNIKEIRDEIVHRGGHTLVFERPGSGILYQVYSRFFTTVIKPLMGIADGNVIDFRRYGSLLLAQLLLFLERLADKLRARIPADHNGIGDAKMGGIGWDIFLKWLSIWESEKTS
jgi:hypothetical protein